MVHTGPPALKTIALLSGVNSALCTREILEGYIGECEFSNAHIAMEPKTSISRNVCWLGGPKKHSIFEHVSFGEYAAAILNS